MLLEHKVALITGASRGIGKAIALELGKQGASIAGTATTENSAHQIDQYLQDANIKGMGLVMDVNHVEQINAGIDRVQKSLGGISILVNNAGITRDNLLARMKDEEWDAIMQTNLKSVFQLSRAVLRAMMKARSGRIINISSVVGATGNAGQTNYAAAKAGMVGFSKSLAKEIGSRHITVNCVAPGFIDTDMTRALSPDQQQALIQHIPLGRLGRPEDVAAAVAFLASPAADYITGTTLHVNGGMYMD
ncbi:3-oxoacyl-ACP reductase FabG [Nitrosomonas halophila]|jgi:3-oxoacyl-[acyl-carrier protein] reductase|uniref:3-oxoacyl-[acyl-carrier-protein] reductase n=1 Tax=Nitrosomonas halophila TaxID=44576 RepID=A0A1H3GRR9_9PROT|nr:3-oxoacyl-ACP reductase FabG [Nitrosomonas halophila]SDY05807.1 3-oxoacyl-[acyl-carrier protein] reductase [Nitrosomonas halophila]